MISTYTFSEVMIESRILLYLAITKMKGSCFMRTSLYALNKSFTGSSLPAETSIIDGLTEQRMDTPYYRVVAHD